MPEYQAYNGRIKAWVKYKQKGKKTLITDVKQKEPKRAFKGVPKRGNRK